MTENDTWFWLLKHMPGVALGVSSVAESKNRMLIVTGSGSRLSTCSDSAFWMKWICATTSTGAQGDNQVVVET